ncbi:MAG: hypothetical protein K0S32_3526 [Bacteroidetes bacterium]|jgi:hypothetical protein|nr:hypothetical protein [Bacteroidota bacterium]
MKSIWTFTVETDRTLYMKGLYQWETYSGLLEGLPTDKMNQGILENIAKDAKRHVPFCDAVYVIQPEQTPFPYEREHPYPFGKPMSLPDTVCVTNLYSLEPVRNEDGEGSQLTVVWFQENYAFPIDVEIRDKIMQIEWSKVAESFYY